MKIKYEIKKAIPLTQASQFNVGDTIIVNERPGLWSSGGKDWKCPKDRGVEYPVIGRIIELQKSYTEISFCLDNGYGFCWYKNKNERIEHKMSMSKVLNPE